MTRKHFNAIAEAVASVPSMNMLLGERYRAEGIVTREANLVRRDDVVRALEQALKQFNPAFNLARFYEACWKGVTDAK